MLLGLLVSVVDEALSFNIAILVFVVTTRVGSAPIDKDIDALPDSNIVSSSTEVKVFEELGFGTRLAPAVVNFEESKPIDNFTKET